MINVYVKLRYAFQDENQHEASDHITEAFLLNTGHDK